MSPVLKEQIINAVQNVLFEGMAKVESKTKRWSVKAYRCGTIIRVDIKEKLEIVQRDQKLIADIVADRTKLSVSEVEQMFLETKTMTPDEAKTKDIVAEVREAKIPDGAPVMQFVFQRK